MKEDTPKGAITEGTTTAATTPRIQPTELPDLDAEATSPGEGSQTTEGTTLAPSSSNISAKDQPASESETKGKAADSEGSNLVGKINNLMSTDLGNVTEARRSSP